MSAIASIVAFDGASTPVSHTLLAISVSRNPKGDVQADWREGVASVPVYAQVRAKTLVSVLKSGTFRVECETTVPVMETVSGQNAAGYTAAPKVALENTIRSICNFSPRSDITGRRLVRQLHLNILGGVTTSVAPVVTGPFAEAIDQLISPT